MTSLATGYWLLGGILHDDGQPLLALEGAVEARDVAWLGLGLGSGLGLGLGSGLGLGPGLGLGLEARDVAVLEGGEDQHLRRHLVELLHVHAVSQHLYGM